VVSWSGFVVPGVLEAGGVRVGEVEWPVSVTIIDSIQFLTFHDWALSVSGMLGSSGFSSNSITKSEDVLESRVLESVWVDIDKTSAVDNVSIDEFSMGFTWWVNISMSEWFFKDSSSINISESGNLFIELISVNLKHFPSEHNIDSSLVAFIKSDLVGIWESEDFLVWSPVLNSSTGSRSSLELILSHERFIVESVEIVTLTLVWTSWGIADHITVGVVPSMIVVSIGSFLVVEHVNKNVVLFWGLSHFWETFDVVIVVVKTWSENQGFIGVFSSI
jgi:hypothetical protein